QGGEQNHLADVGLVGQEHHQAVDSDSEATGGGHPVFQSLQEVLVDGVSLVVAGGTGLHLALESPPLVDGVVELGEGVGVLGAGDDQFEAVGDVGVFAAAGGQRRHLGRVMGNEGRLPDGVL